jgi:hydroxyacid-oxoacid transhydrogenase
MSCAHGLVSSESIFSIDASNLAFGPGAVAEAGAQLAALGARRVAIFTDPRVAKLEPLAVVRASLAAANVDYEVFRDCHVEPKDAYLTDAVAFAREGRFDGYLSVGGGSAIDTCKLAALYATYPAELLAYVNAPVGEGRAIPGPLPPHVACPTTSGTGSECTGIAVFDLRERNIKTAVASRRLRPTLALVDPTFTASLPSEVVAASGFDVLCHALESFTARRFDTRARPTSAALRPMSQGQNPWSDLGSREALRLAGAFFVRAVVDASDGEARAGLSWAATLAGIAFGNAGVHLPHAMSYAVAGLVRDYHAPGYPDHGPMVPHGVSVIVSAPSVFRATASTDPARHLEAAALLGADVRGAGPDDAGEILGRHIERLMQRTRVPLGLGALGYTGADLDALARGAAVQRRLLDNAPMAVDEPTLRDLFAGAMRYEGERRS